METKEKILAVDQNTGLLMSLKFFLKKYYLTTTRSRSEAAALLDKEHFDLLLFDIPHAVWSAGEYDREALVDLKVIHLRHPNLPVIALSTEPNIRTAHSELKDLGIVQGISKTNEFDKEVIKAVENALKK